MGGRRGQVCRRRVILSPCPCVSRRVASDAPHRKTGGGSKQSKMGVDGSLVSLPPEEASSARAAVPPVYRNEAVEIRLLGGCAVLDVAVLRLDAEKEEALEGADAVRAALEEAQKAGVKVDMVIDARGAPGCPSVSFIDSLAQAFEAARSVSESTITTSVVCLDGSCYGTSAAALLRSYIAAYPLNGVDVRIMVS